MKPPYNITGEIFRLVSEISQKIGEVNASFITKQSPELRKTNRIRTIQASLAVEGNTLSVDQIMAIIENKKFWVRQKIFKKLPMQLKCTINSTS